jgi:two-component system OmpR family sensor kinase
MTSLVDDLLLLARLDSGRPLQMSVVDLSVLVIDAVTDAHAAGPLHRWKLDLPDESVRLMGDRARLHQVLANLLANARTHTPPGTSVTVSVRRASAGTAELSVIDDGPGIPPELLPTVFERFARGDTSRSRTAGSTGLGLAIVEAVVEAHGGDIAVTSKPGRTAFTVVLPMTDEAASTDAVQPASSHGAHRSGTTRS